MPYLYLPQRNDLLKKFVRQAVTVGRPAGDEMPMLQLDLQEADKQEDVPTSGEKIVKQHLDYMKNAFKNKTKMSDEEKHYVNTPNIYLARYFSINNPIFLNEKLSRFGIQK